MRLRKPNTNERMSLYIYICIIFKAYLFCFVLLLLFSESITAMRHVVVVLLIY